VKTPYLDFEERWSPTREAFAAELCVCRRVREIHSRNVQTFAEHGRAWDTKLSTILWGGAGYLARGDYARVQYMPHPLRESLFERANFLLRPGSALRRFEKFVASERTKLFTRFDGSGCIVRVSFPYVRRTVRQPRRNLRFRFRDLFAMVQHKSRAFPPQIMRVQPL
jgi:hypothetical protein